MLMTLSWIPDPLKQQIVDHVIDFITRQAEGLIGQEMSGRIRGLTAKGAFRKALSDAFQRGVERFEREYGDQDEDLTAAILNAPDFWQNPTVQQSILTLVTNPGLPRPDAQAAVIAQFETVLSGRRNRDRVDRAVSYLLRTVAEEIWAVPGADNIRQLYLLQMQRLNTEALQEQIALLRANVQQTQQLGEGMRQALLQLTAAAEQKLLAAPPSQILSQRSRPYHNLPHRSYTKFVGRKAEKEQLQQLMRPSSRHFLVTLVGIGGVGKSTLAQEYAYYYRDHFDDLPTDERFEAIVWVSAKRTILTASGIQQREQEFKTLGDLYREIAVVLEQTAILQVETEQRGSLVKRALTGQRTLLIIDNLETVDDDKLLAFLRDLPEPTKAIVTTRHRIDIAYPLPLAGMPENDALALMAFEAARKNVSLPVEHTGDLFKRTGGIPLAIVWSIGKMSLGYDVEAVLRRLGAGHSDITAFSFNESYELIRGRDSEKLLLALPLFDQSVNRIMLGQVAGLGDDEIGRDDGLALLEQLSLVNKQGDRFSLLPLTRVFALEQLSEQPQLETELRERWVTHLIEIAKPYGGLHWRWRDRLQIQREGDHFVNLSTWAQATGRFDVVLAIIPALIYYYDMAGQWADLLHIGRIGVDYARLVGDLEKRIFIQHFISWVLSHQGKHDEAERASQDALEAAHQTGDGAWVCGVLHNFAQAARRRGAYDRARAFCEEALMIVPTLPIHQQELVRADMHYALGKLARDQSDWITAQNYLLAAREIFRLEDKQPVVNVEFAWGLLSSLGLVEHHLGHLEEAARMFSQSLALYRTTGGKGDLATMLIRFAALETDRGNLAIARQYAQEALEWSQRLGMVQERAQAEVLCKRLGA
jgi:tetratricopeptide (TPR) repeat protein